MALSKEQFAALRAKGLSVDQIVAFEAGRSPAPAPTPSVPPRVVGNPVADALKARLTGALPALGAAPGGFVPGPLGWAISAAGGMAGKGAQMAMTGDRPGPSMSFLDALAARGPGFLGAMLPPQVVEEGAKQAALGVTGGAVAAPVRGLGVAAYRGALRPTASLVQKFPNVVRQMMKAKVPLGGVGEKSGEAVAGKKLGEAIARRGVVLDKAEMGGAVVGTDEALQQARALIAEVGRSGFKTNQRVKILEKELGNIMDDVAPNLSPNEAQRLLKSLQDEVDAVFAAKAQGTYIKGGRRLVTKLHARLESGLRKSLRAAVPGLQSSNEAIQAASVAQAGTALARRNINKGVPARVPLVPTAVRAMMPDELRSIELWSRLGLGMADPATLALLRQSPRAAEMLFNSGTLPDSLSDER